MAVEANLARLWALMRALWGQPDEHDYQRAGTGDVSLAILSHPLIRSPWLATIA